MYGLQFATANLSSLLASVYATNRAGVGGGAWRAVFRAFAAASWAVGCAVLVFAREPARAGRGGAPPPLAHTLRAALAVMRLPTFACIIVQGAFGTMPWVCVPWLTLLYQAMGCSDRLASGLYACFSLGTLVGVTVGGAVSDRLAARDPDRGRIAAAIFSVAAGASGMHVVLRLLPLEPSAAPAHAAALFASGALFSWCGGINATLFSDIVPPHLRSTVYALDRALEVSIASFAAPVLGRLAEARGYAVVPPGLAPALAAAARARNVAALAAALAWSMTWPVAVCLLTYCVLYARGYYAVDRERARAATTEKEPGPDAQPALQLEPSAARRQLGVGLALALVAAVAARRAAPAKTADAAVALRGAPAGGAARPA